MTAFLKHENGRRAVRISGRQPHRESKIPHYLQSIRTSRSKPDCIGQFEAVQSMSSSRETHFNMSQVPRYLTNSLIDARDRCRTQVVIAHFGKE